VKLSSLLKAVKRKNIEKKTGNGMDPEIGSIHCRAQYVKPGGLFVAIPGFVRDGHDFIDDALARGASAILTEKPKKKDAIIIEVENTRKALAEVSSRFFGHPSQRLVLIAVTGTNGKTTVSYLVESILTKAGLSTGVIGTINYRFCEKTFCSPVTTPESLDLQRILSEMIADGVTHAVMEVSSHAIDLFRVESCQFDIGVFTNLSQDHLDFHKNMDSYWACKKRLFFEILSLSPKKSRARAVINCDDMRGGELSRMLSIPSLTTGRSDGNMIWPSHVDHDRSGIMGRISTPVGAFDIKSSLVGRHNLDNILCATGVGIALNLPLDAIRAGIEAVSSVPGRLEPIANAMGRFVYIDYAHTPDALENVLTSLQQVAADRIICVFGCGGDRDKEKRPQMGKIAGRLCNLSVITSDNPRTEPSMEIITQIHRGIQQTDLVEYMPSGLTKGFHHKGYVIEPDRKRAIRLGITASRPGDTILIAGKGHETYQVIGNRSVAFDDSQEAKKVLADEGMSDDRTDTVEYH